MKTLIRLAAVLTAVALALPAFACDEHKTTTATASDTKSSSKAPVAKADKADKASKKEKKIAN